MRWLCVPLAVIALASCADQTPHAVTVAGAGGIPVFIVGESPEKLPFDPRSARLQAATQQLTQIAGHPIAFQFDAALLPQWRSSFEDALIGAIENVATNLATLKEKEPLVYAHGAPLLQRIECKYSAVSISPSATPREKKEDEPHLDPATRAIVVTGPPERWSSLVPQDLVTHALRREFELYVARMYGEVEPESVPPGEREAYFAYVTAYRDARPKKGEERDTRPPAEIFASAPRAVTIVKVARLADLVGGSNPELAKKITHWLTQETGYFTNAYNHEASFVSAASPSSPWRRAESAWVRWANQKLPTMSEDDQLSIVRHTYVRTLSSDRAQGAPEYAAFAFPGFDRYAFAMRVFDAWAKAGHPTQLTTPKISSLQEFITCPHPRNEDGHRSLGPQCDYDFYRDAMDGPANKKRLVEAVLQRNDPAFTETVFVNVRHTQSDALPAVLEVMRALEANPSAWEAGARLVAEDLARDKTHLLDEVRRLWRTYPARRGTLLLILANMDPYGNGELPWKDFAQMFGSTVSGPDFTSYLDKGSEAMNLAHVVWPALGRGFSRAAAIVPHLDGFIATEEARAARHGGGPGKAISSIVQSMCQEGDNGDLAQIHAYFTRRVGTHPGESFSGIVDDTTPGRCHPDHDPESHAAKPRAASGPTPIGPPRAHDARRAGKRH